MSASKLRQVTNSTIVGDTATHCIDQYMVLFHYWLLGGNIAMSGGLGARLCHIFLVGYIIRISDFFQWTKIRRQIVLSALVLLSKCRCYSTESANMAGW